MNDITKQNEKISKARRLLLDEDIEASDYKEIKADCEAVIARLEVKLQGVLDSKIVRLDIPKLTDRIISSFCSLDKLFEKATLQKQRHILSSLFPEKIEFDGVQHRTPRTNIIARSIWLINNDLKGLKIDTAPDFQTLYQRVVPTRIELISKV